MSFFNISNFFIKSNAKQTIATVSSQEGSIKRVLFVNHSIPPYEYSGTPLSTWSHVVGLHAKGIETAVIIPSPRVKTGVNKQLIEGHAVYEIPFMDKYAAFLSLYDTHTIESYRVLIDQILNDFKPELVQVNDYVCLPVEILSMLKAQNALLVRNVCNDEEICHCDSPVYANGIEGVLCSGPETIKKCTDCFLYNKLELDSNPTAISKEPIIQAGQVSRKNKVQNAYNTIVDGVIFTEENFKNHFCQYVNIAASKIKVIPRGIAFSQKRSLTAIVMNKAKVTFGFVGHVGYHKGADVLLKAFEQLAAQVDFELVIHGQVLQKEFLKWMSELAIMYPGKLKYAGEFNKDDQQDYANKISQIDMAIVPSYFDAYNRVVRELMYYGMPLIVSNFHGSSIVKHGENGLKFDAGDAVGLANLMREVIKNPKLVEQLSTGVIATHIPSVDEETTQMLQFYQQLKAGQLCELANP